MSREFSHTRDTNASVAALWSIWTDVDGWPRWDALKSAYLDGPFAVGATGFVRPERGAKSGLRIDFVEVDRRYTASIALPGCRLILDRKCQPNESGARFSHRVAFVGPTAFLFSRILGPGFERQLPGVMDRVAALAEGSRP